MYRKSKFLSILNAIRQEMSREADYDIELFAEMVRSGKPPVSGPARNLRGVRVYAPRAQGHDEIDPTPRSAAR